MLLKALVRLMKPVCRLYKIAADLVQECQICFLYDLARSMGTLELVTGVEIKDTRWKSVGFCAAEH